MEQAREQAREAREQARAAQDQAKATRNQDDSSDQKTTDKSDTKTDIKSDQKSNTVVSDKKADKKTDTASRNDDPPETIAELLKRMLQPTPSQPAAVGRSQQGEKAAPPQAEKPAAPVVPATTVVPPKPRPAIAPTTLPSTYVANEILALNPGPRLLSRASELQFKVGPPTDLTRLGMSIYRLTPPAGSDAIAARTLLEQTSRAENSLVDATLTLNRVYRPYRAATAERETSVDGDRVRQATTGGCSPERCYASPAIGWRNELRGCARGFKVGVIDTAVDHRHPAFADAHVQIGTSIGEGRRPATSAHGTGIFALLAGAPNSGTPGLIPQSDFYLADIFHADAHGQPVADTIALLKALDWMDAWDVKVVNISVAGSHDELMERAIDALSEKGMIFVAAAGNEGPTADPMFPAAYKKVIAVTAVAKDLRSFRQANRGKYIDVAAPGVDIWTAMPGSKETYQTGTSFAVPFVTAVVAASYQNAKKKTKDAILNSLDYKDLGTPGPDPIFGRGLVLAPASCPAAPAAVETPVVSSRPVATPIGTASGVALGFASTR